MKTLVLLTTLLCMATFLFGQDNPNPEGAASPDTTLPYYQIPDYPESYTAESVAARLIDGLGFRYYWATDGLRPEDLAFKPNDEARTSSETIEHILGLSEVVVNAVRQLPNKRGAEDATPLSFEEMRRQTLENLKAASDILKTGKTQLEDCKLVFENGDRRSEYPFWNNLNGPIADALWHTGQVVSFRRSSGNPFNSKVSVFQGKIRN
ncbi:MAG: hypothetical protein H6574_14905 [Lewinellaceae bacterium]|nr:hypothetical protein [Saprospiraceae bacterium]MCB9315248.1 hypothetical protein [Lewinellaceae bacterium]MCB9332368.1 hypothetical protein [Lewinellaceae bacterium]